MSQSPHSPPRRARPLPQVPAPYLSQDFSAAAQALHLIENPNQNLYATLTTLRTLRDNIYTSLHSTAPQWSSLTPAIAALQSALEATQNATNLRETISKMRDNVPSRDNYPARMASTVHRAAQLSANVSLATTVREFAHLLRAADVPDSILFPVQPHASPRQPTTSSQRDVATMSDRPAPIFHLPPRFLQRAAALHRARTAAHTPPLAHVTALDDARASLARQHSSLQTELETVLVDAIYAPIDPKPVTSLTNPEGTHSFAPASTQKSPSAPPSPLPPDIFPSLVQAVDLLGEPNHAANVLQNAAPACLITLFRDALLADPVLPSSTIGSIPPSSLTTPSLSTKRQPCSPNSHIVQPMHVFGNELSHVSRRSCAAVFERVRLSMTAVLRRLSALAEAIDTEESTIFSAVQQIWQTMEATLISFVQAMLAFPSPKPKTPFEPSSPPDTKKSGSRPSQISLLPPTSRKASQAPCEATAASWQLDRSQPTLDSLTTLVHNTMSLTPSIYNLEVAYSPLQQFIMMSTRLQHSWKEHGAHTRSQAPGVSPLSQVLIRAVDLFMTTVRNDVRKYMHSVLGNRAGTLLQPCSRRQRRGTSTTSLLSAPAHTKDDVGSAASHLLPLLPQSQMVINVIASCLSLGVAVPSIAGRIGDVVNRDVIFPFCERAIYALELVGGWSDSGTLFRRMWDQVATDDALHSEEGDSDLTGDVKGGSTKEIPNKAEVNASYRGHLLNTLRGKRGLTTQCLEQLCEQKTWYTGNKKLLMENEWNAVVRLVANAKIIISQLESCVGKSGDSAVERMVLDTATSHMGNSGDCYKLISLRGILQVRGISSSLHGPIVEAIQRTQAGCLRLREEVIEKGLIFLHCEVALHCFTYALKTLVDDGAAQESKEKGRNSLEDGKATTNGGGTALSRPSSIFKALPIQLSDVERTSEEESGGMNEFDEFGDRIAIGSETVTEPEIEECAFPNSLLLEQNDWKSMHGDEEGRGGPRHIRDEIMLGQSVTQTVTRSDKRALQGGRRFGEDVKVMDGCIRQNLGELDRKFVLSQADESVGLGIRISGEMRGKGDRDVATGARLFMDAAATVAADTLGWPVVESDYSVAEGASQSASECRTLLFAAGML